MRTKEQKERLLELAKKAFDNRDITISNQTFVKSEDGVVGFVLTKEHAKFLSDEQEQKELIELIDLGYK